jgi:hypothetical protein
LQNLPTCAEDGFIEIVIFHMGDKTPGATLSRSLLHLALDLAGHTGPLVAESSATFC